MAGRATLTGRPYTEWNTELCACRAETPRGEDTITVTTLPDGFSRVFTNLPFGTVARVRRRNDPRELLGSTVRVGKDGSVAVATEVARWVNGATITAGVRQCSSSEGIAGYRFGNVGAGRTETVEIERSNTAGTEFKACFRLGAANTLCPSS